MIKRFYDFGYFQEDLKNEQYINMAKSVAELKLFELPSDIEKMLVQIAELETSLLGSSYGISSDDLIVETACIFRFNRTSGKIKDVMAKGLTYLFESGLIEENAGKIIASNCHFANYKRLYTRTPHEQI